MSSAASSRRELELPGAGAGPGQHTRLGPSIAHLLQQSMEGSADIRNVLDEARSTLPQIPKGVALRQVRSELLTARLEGALYGLLDGGNVVPDILLGWVFRRGGT